ncbi:alpha/beta hydrolase [Spongiimicrobium sp. 3-5]|uniref:alpha/beta hydrolase n=1 Tax=Spongiimicrobium sp. 3-5 TaxID=3332596 RepID=UPI00397EACBB
MKHQEKQVTYTTTNSYATLNQLSKKTKYVWLVCHGIGYLSKYFLKYFEGLPPGENYIIAPQAPSKYYLNGEYRHVGASWLTRENTATEITNVVTYISAVLTAERLPLHCKLIVFGYSQGAAIAARWVARTQQKCHQLVLHSGSIPNELVPADFDFLKENNTQVTILVGNKDEYLNPERMELESKKIDTLFQGRAKQVIFEGKHEVNKKLINSLI